MSYALWTRGAWLALALCAGGVNQADQPHVTPQPGILVLRSGRVLRGEIVQVGDRYVVTLGGKDELGVPADSVELQCASLEEAYQRKRAALHLARPAAEHLALADWCLRYELLAPAAEQVAAARQAEPDNPAVAAFERRLQMAHRQTTPVDAPRPAAPPLVSQNELDQFVRRMPPGTVEQFTNFVQPLLINRCGNSGCHGPNSTAEFRLEYPHWSRTLPRRFTQQNLRATMQYVDQDKPLDSPLLAKATAAHGTCQHPALASRNQAQLQQLVDWVQRCATDHAPPGSPHSAHTLLLQPDFPRRAASGRRAPAADTAPTSMDHPAQSATEPARGPLDAPPPAASSTAPEPAPTADDRAQDPFDPALFNRRHAQRTP